MTLKKYYQNIPISLSFFSPLLVFQKNNTPLLCACLPAKAGCKVCFFNPANFITFFFSARSLASKPNTKRGFLSNAFTGPNVMPTRGNNERKAKICNFML